MEWSLLPTGEGMFLGMPQEGCQRPGVAYGRGWHLPGLPHAWLGGSSAQWLPGARPATGRCAQLWASCARGPGCF